MTSDSFFTPPRSFRSTGRSREFSRQLSLPLRQSLKIFKYSSHQEKVRKRRSFLKNLGNSLRDGPCNALSLPKVLYANQAAFFCPDSGGGGGCFIRFQSSLPLPSSLLFRNTVPTGEWAFVAVPFEALIRVRRPLLLRFADPIYILAGDKKWRWSVGRSAGRLVPSSSAERERPPKALNKRTNSAWCAFIADETKD